VLARVHEFFPQPGQGFRFDARFDLVEELRALGMPLALKPGADFSGISTAAKLFISRVIHQAFVDVTEGGTEAAAATASLLQPPPGPGGGGGACPTSCSGRTTRSCSWSATSVPVRSCFSAA
jgi:Serpin (serine protease inhibitor)